MTRITYQILLPLPFDYGFSYFSDKNLSLEIGDIALVPFRKKKLFGVVISKNQKDKININKIKTIINKEEKLKFNSQLLTFINWVANYNMAPKGLILKLSLSTLNSSKEPKKPKIFQPKLMNIRLEPLSKNQQQSSDFLNKQQKFSTILLDGITGSGKTEVYFHKIASIIKQPNKQVLILLPEITLTSQLCLRFKQQFSLEPDLWHSKISPSKKRELFFRIANGSCQILIGTRSALFLPFKNLQLIIVDEEHDTSFKQEDIVNYSGRDMAIMRSKIENIPIILSSATPSLESYLNAKNNKYHLIKLTQRFGQQKKTVINILDMRQEKLLKNQSISHQLKTLLEDNLKNNRQSLLFLNRRGYAPLTICQKCGYKITCNNCSSYLTLHQRTHSLTCHHCGSSHKSTNICPSCNEKDCLKNCGVGIEKLQEETQKYFPTAKIGLMTSDNIKNNDDAKIIINKIIQQEIDIIIGTQMIAKGHHFPSLSLVGIIDGDGSFLGGSLRTAERSFQLLTQVIGRAGREYYQGQVILQTYNPSNQIFKTIIENTRDDFLDNEAKNRQEMNFPPFSKMAKIIFSGFNENQVINFAKLTLKQFPINQKIEIFGPAPLPITRIKNRYHYCLNITTNKTVNIQKLISDSIKNIPHPSSIRIKIDIDPI